MQTIKSLRRAVKPLLLGAAGVALVAGATGYGTYYWRTARFLEFDGRCLRPSRLHGDRSQGPRLH